MKYFVVIITIATIVSVFQIEGTHISQLYALDGTVSDAIQGISEFMEVYNVTISARSDHLLYLEKENASKSIMQIRQEVEKLEEEAKTDGKNIERCLKNINLELNRALRKVVSKLQKSFERAALRVLPYHRKINGLITKGEKLRDRVREIDRNCRPEELLSPAREKCIAEALPPFRRIVRLYQKSVRKVWKNMFPIVKRKFSIIVEFNREPLATFENEIQGARMDALKCIEVAY